MRPEDDEDDEGGEGEDECEAPCVESWMEGRCEGSGRRGGEKAAEDSSFFVVFVGVVRMASIVCEQWGS